MQSSYIVRISLERFVLRRNEEKEKKEKRKNWDKMVQVVVQTTFQNSRNITGLHNIAAILLKYSVLVGILVRPFLLQYFALSGKVPDEKKECSRY